jgi:hypothetical protein
MRHARALACALASGAAPFAAPSPKLQAELFDLIGHCFKVMFDPTSAMSFSISGDVYFQWIAFVLE